MVAHRLEALAVPMLAACIAALVASGYGNAGASSASRGRCGTRLGALAVPGHEQRIPHFSHVVIVVFENKEFGEVIGSSQAPTFRRLAKRGAFLTNYCGVAHPSLPNYLALVSGSTHGIDTDCTACAVAGRNLADTLERAGLTWKTYAEGLPRRGFTGAQAGRYAKKHNPFLYFRDVFSSRRRLARIVPLRALKHDLAARSLPSFSLVIPDLCHDMHDCSVATGDRWLASFLPPLVANPQLRHGVVFIVFDEGAESDLSGGGGHTVAVVVGRTVKPGSRSVASLDHYNLLRTVEAGLRLPRLGRSRTARPIRGIWR
jgi:hypothetical protein